MTGRRTECGQATVELVAVLPMVIVVALAAGQALAAGAAAQMAGHAAQAGAAALLQDGDPRRAAHDALPDWSRSRLTLEVEGRRVSVEVRPVAALPGLAKLLAAEARADAGPRP